VSICGGAFAQTTPTPAPGTVAPSLVLVCALAPTGAPASAYCPNDANGNPQIPTVLQGYILSSTDYASLEAAIAPFDYTLAGSLFGMGAGLVVSSYFLAYPLGVLARMLRSARG
jgi:hypothetical protein